MPSVDWLKELVAAGPSVVYLMFLITIFMLCRRDGKESREQMEAMIIRYEALLERTIAALTQVADMLERERDDKKKP